MAAGVEDVTHLLDREDGTAFSEDNVMFTSFDGGAVFDYDSTEARNIKKMLEVDGKARTLEAVLTLPIRRVSTSIRRGDAPAEVAKLVERALMGSANNGGMSTPLATVIAQMANAVVYRKAFFEKVLTERDGHVVYDKLAWRPPSTCTIVRDPRTAAFNGFNQMPFRLTDTKEIRIPTQRALVYIHGQHRDPLNGSSDLDIAHWCYLTKQKIRFLWYQFLEGQSLPKTIVRHTDSQEKADAAARKLLGLRSGGIAAIHGDPDELSVTPFESSGRGATQFKEALQWLDAEASGSVLAGFTDLGAAAAGGTGSFALSKDQTDFFQMSRQAVAREMQDTINQYMIPDLVRYNFGPDVASPVFEFGPIAEDDMSSAITLLQSANGVKDGAIPREFMEELIERVAGFLELSQAKVRKGLERAAKEAEEKAKQLTDNPAAAEVAGVAGAVGAATDAVAAAGRATQLPGGQNVRIPGRRIDGSPATVRTAHNADPRQRRLRPVDSR